MINQLEKLTAEERLDYFINYLKNRDQYPPQEREKLDQYFQGL